MANKPVDKLEHNAAALKRWRSRLKRAITMIDKLEKQRRRLEAKPRPVPIAPAVITATEVAALCDIELDTGIPAFLQRKQLDPVAAEIKAEQEATKKQKAAGRIAKMKAKKSGELTRMPLTGKAALDAILKG